jgi:hypothetical protein
MNTDDRFWAFVRSIAALELLRIVPMDEAGRLSSLSSDANVAFEASQRDACARRAHVARVRHRLALLRPDASSPRAGGGSPDGRQQAAPAVGRHGLWFFQTHHNE